MALTVTELFKTSAGGRRWHAFLVDFDSSYPTGGEVLTKATLGFAYAPDAVVAFDRLGFSFEHDLANEKLKVLAAIKTYAVTHDAASRGAVTSGDEAMTATGVASTDVCVGHSGPVAQTAGTVLTGARVTGADQITGRLTNPSAGTVDTASGSYALHTVAANGAGLELANATDLSALTDVIVWAFGKN